MINRREFLKAGALVCVPGLAGRLLAAGTDAFAFKYVIGSSIFGNLPLSAILPEVRRCGAEFIDLWPKIHGTQREEVDAMGYEKFADLLNENRVKVGLSTRFDLGPYKLADEYKFLQKFGGNLVVTGLKKPSGLTGGALRTEIRKFVEQMKPHLAGASEAGVSVAIENHANTLLEYPDAMRWLAEFSQGLPLGVAMAPYHMDQDAAMLARLIRDLGPKLLLFYAWQYGKGCMKPMPAEDELMQLPGHGPLDFDPLLRALRDTNFKGWTEIFMHHTPRGLPILPTADQVAAELIGAREYLERHASR